MRRKKERAPPPPSRFPGWGYYKQYSGDFLHVFGSDIFGILCGFAVPSLRSSAGAARLNCAQVVAGAPHRARTREPAPPPPPPPRRAARAGGEGGRSFGSVFRGSALRCWPRFPEGRG